jgi:hypothetical protein
VPVILETGQEVNTARVYEATIRDVQAVGKPYRYLEGRAVPYDTFADIGGFFLEAHAVDSFKRSTKGGTGKGLPLLLFHNNQSWPIGHAESWEHRSDGMHGVWRLNDRPESQQAAQMAESGDLVGLSVGFQPIRSQWTLVEDYAPDLGPAHMDSVIRKESRLVETSMTPTPAFADAGVTAVRSAGLDAMHIQQRSKAFRPQPSQVDAWRRTVDQLRSR